MILFACDLTAAEAPRPEGAPGVRVERKRAETELDPPDLDRILQVTNPTFTQMAERFERARWSGWPAWRNRWPDTAGHSAETRWSRTSFH